MDLFKNIKKFFTKDSSLKGQGLPEIKGGTPCPPYKPALTEGKTKCGGIKNKPNGERPKRPPPSQIPKLTDERKQYIEEVSSEALKRALTPNHLKEDNRMDIPGYLEHIESLEEELKVYKALVEELVVAAIDFQTERDGNTLRLKIDTSKVSKAVDKVMSKQQ